MGVQVAAPLLVFFLLFRFAGVKPLVGVTQVDIQEGSLFLPVVQIKRPEGSPVTGDVFEHAYLVASADGIFPHEGALTQMGFQRTGERTGLHLFLLLLLPLLFCQGGFFFPYFFFHLCDAAVQILFNGIKNRIGRSFGRHGFRCRPLFRQASRRFRLTVYFGFLP